MDNILTKDSNDNSILASKQASKQADISILRIIATLAIILLHTCSAISDNYMAYSLENNQLFVLSSIAYSLRWGVPIFLMITGALLIREDRDYTYNIILFKYCRRIMLALFVFGVPFSMIEIVMNSKTISFFTFLEGCINVILGKSWAHLWYLYALLGLYLVLPLINSFYKNVNKTTINLFEIIVFIFTFLVPIVERIFSINIGFSIPVGSYTVFYFLAGKMLYESKNQIINNKRIHALMLLMLFILLIYLNSIKVSYCLGYDSPIIAMIAIDVFLLFKGVTVNIGKYHWVVDRLCFGVYIIHPLFINFMYKFLKITPLKFDERYLLGLFTFWFIFVVCAFITSYLMSLIQPLKKWVL